jgi:hypothetical protein
VLSLVVVAPLGVSRDQQTSRWAITRVLKTKSIKIIKSVGGYGYAINTDKNKSGNLAGGQYLHAI